MERKQTHIPYAFVTAIAIIIYLAVLYITGNSFKPGLSTIAYAIFLVGIILNAINYSKVNNANVTFGQVFGSGFKATAIIVLVTIAWTVLSFYIFPDMKDKMIDYIREQALKNVKGKDEDVAENIEKGISMFTDHLKLFVSMSTAFYNLVAGLIFSLIGAAVAKKNPQQVYPG